MAHLLHGTAFITGAGSGIGAGVARKFIQNGVSKLALVDINSSNLQNVSESLKQTSPYVELLTASVDVTNEAQVNNAVQKAATKFGRVDIGVNCAGVGDPGKPTHQSSLRDWQRTVDINQTGVWMSQRALLQQMLAQTSCGTRRGRGVIVNVCSTLGITASATGIPFPAYISSKHGKLSRDAKYYAPSGIRINAVCPGFVHTPMISDAVDSGVFKKEVESTPIGRVADVEEITDSILFLASPMSSYVYGAGLVVDGGYGL
ncbi:SDR family NAD(P)-dependent oxidoreductase [Aspergillus vadensis CBS 113365]|uniref:Short chain dehydrogenase/ reductase n=1 Tax=Aspergillus vadensis (strain CBS 113365 / IMI 142717 / IBT 24658) TaxID=1448311 RepID=A0A319C8X9_ASPVC|nr:short chain dehydrogenase/ reductase [Aspergillus vadensis CBS 113365]PYH71798.1 short chain dehydrogenase/ reductase [Aspergillus vadensis CBS 113365]